MSTDVDSSSIPCKLEQLRATFKSCKTLDYKFRLDQLRALSKMISDNMEQIIDAVLQDFKKPRTEIRIEILYVLSAIEQTISNLKKWMSPKKRQGNLLNLPNTLKTVYEPYGVVLVISPWNYPFILAMEPLHGAIAAGNCAVLKPSEYTPNTSQLYMELVSKYLDPECFVVFTGGPEVSTALLTEKFDFIFFTGSTRVGKIVMSKAAQNLTPVCLELGGKCPCYVDADSDIFHAARKVAWGSTINAGQVCISVDFVLCQESVFDEFVETFKQALVEFYSEDARNSPDYGRIVNKQHFDRLNNLITQTTGTVLIGGPDKNDPSDLYIEPSLVHIETLDDILMKEEIFGPIIPIIKVRDHEEALAAITSMDKPLVLYAFCTKKEVIEKFTQRTSSGTLVFNEVYLQMSVPDLPFGGVGASGFGSYHGKKNFTVFSHQKGIYSKGFYVHALENITLPPMTETKFKIVRRFI